MATVCELHSPARCIVAKVAEEEHHDFFVATYSLRGSNEVRRRAAARARRPRSRSP